jgi:hypothetical protein
MAIPSIYINLEDDVSKIVERLKHNSATQLVLVCPKRSFLFSDGVNLRLLKKQTELLGKELFILTMDEKGQLYAREAGFQLKFLPKAGDGQNFSDVKFSQKKIQTANNEIITAPAQPKLALKKNLPTVTKNSSRRLPSKSVEVASTTITAVEPVADTVEITDTIFPPDENIDLAEKEVSGKSKVAKVVLTFTLICVIILLALNFVVLPKASVVIFPKSEPVTRDMSISISTSVQTPDPDKLVMPAQTINETVNVTGKFQSQGKSQVGNKAQGSIKIYNFTNLPINLKAQTTTLTVGSKTYKLVNDVSGVRPTTYKNAKTKEVDISSLGEDMEIIAGVGGEDFNLPAGTRVEISNQVFGSKPQLLYAVTSTEISGGTTRYLSIISPEDIASAKKQLEDQALAQIKEKLSSQGLVLADRAYNLNVTQFVTDNPEGTQTPSFGATLGLQISGLSFNLNDLISLIKQRIVQNLSGNKTLEDSKNGQTIYTAKTLDLTNQIGVLQVHYEGQAVYNVDVNNITPELVNKSQNEVNEILRSKAAIDKVEITLAPAWQKKFPMFASKINLTIAKPE